MCDPWWKSCYFLMVLGVAVTGQDTTSEGAGEMTTSLPSTSSPITPFSMEILEIFVPSGIGNAVKLVWGEEDRAQRNVNLTYGVHFGVDEAELEYPKVTTMNTSALIEELEYCTKYSFAVTVLSDSDADPVKVNPNNVRGLITGAEQSAAPTNLTVDLEARARPCLDIKWSSACPNVVTPTGYVISILDKKSSKYAVITVPKSKRSDLVYKLPVSYGDSYEIRVSSAFPGSKAVGPVAYVVPEPLQPYRLKATVNQEEGAFLIYWAEPFVPLSIGRHYYQVFVYPGQDLEAPYEKYYVTRPVMVYKGDLSEYTFCVNLATHDRKHVSRVTALLYANLNGEIYVLNETLSEAPDR
ncbi:uncharacterized protein [Euwallacea fornicatus]|uniref:uncharacterized protein isoform X1 n=2 Tax=Euwallacea fornicatus TaxID=995702 RepID=UPI0033902664